MLRPTKEQLSLLRAFERVAFETCDVVNRVRPIKNVQHAFLRTIGAGWVDASIGPRLHIRGLENIPRDGFDRGVMLISNHRSFFDMYVISCVLLKNTNFIKGMYFPVRSEFFYDGPLGVGVNAVMSGLSMYPPVFRSKEQRRFNEYTVDYLVEAIREPGTLVGMHPEGTRGKGENPYELLPAKPGVGEIVHRSRPVVLPVFTLGLANDFIGEITGTHLREGPPITMFFGPPVRCPHLDATASVTNYQRIAKHLRTVLTDLGQQEREYRQKHNLPIMGPALTEEMPTAAAAELSLVCHVVLAINERA